MTVLSLLLNELYSWLEVDFCSNLHWYVWYVRSLYGTALKCCITLLYVSVPVLISLLDEC